MSSNCPVVEGTFSPFVVTGELCWLDLDRDLKSLGSHLRDILQSSSRANLCGKRYRIGATVWSNLL